MRAWDERASEVLSLRPHGGVSGDATAPVAAAAAAAAESDEADSETKIGKWGRKG